MICRNVCLYYAVTEKLEKNIYTALRIRGYPDIRIDIFHISPGKYMLWILIKKHLAEALLMSTHNISFLKK